MRRFVLVSTARTGSNYIVGMLNTSSVIRCHYELANPGGVIGPMANQQRLTNELRSKDPVAFIETAFDVGSEYMAVGFKIFGGDVPEIADRVMNDSRVMKIFLRRENLLAVYSSEKLAKVTGIWGARSPEDVVKARVLFDPAEFDAYCAYADGFYEAAIEQASRNGHPWMTIHYHRLKEQEQCREIFTFLGVDPPLNPGFDSLKQNPPDIESRFENPDVVKAHLDKINKPQWVKEQIHG